VFIRIATKLIFKMAKLVGISGLFSLVAAMEPLAPLGFQEVWQAGLPAEVHVNYDVPNAGLISELEALKKQSDADASLEAIRSKQSFLKRGSKETQVFFEKQPLATTYESSYNSVLAGLKASIDAEIGSVRGSLSFLEAPAREPTVNIFVDAGKGKAIDVQRLRNDAYAYMKQQLDAFENAVLAHHSFLVGDVNPYPLPTLDVSIEEPAFDATSAADLAGRSAELQKLSSEMNAAYSRFGGIAASRAARLAKAKGSA
jgi:hypothetical protein